jgi:hypothetical protein
MCKVTGIHLKPGSFAEYTEQLLGLLSVQHIPYRHFLNNEDCAEELAYTQVTTLCHCVTSQLYGHPVQGNACNDDHVETFACNKRLWNYIRVAEQITSGQGK